MCTTAYHVRPHLVDFAVDIAFGEQRRHRQAARVDGPAVEVDFQDIFFGNKVRRQAARHQKSVGIAIVPDRHVAPAIEQAVIRKDAAGGDQVFDQLRVRRPGRGGRRLYRRANRPKSGEGGHDQHAAEMLQPARHDKLQRCEAYGSSSVSQ